MCFFSLEEFDRLFSCLTMNAEVGDSVHPVVHGGIERLQAGRQCQSMKEVLFDIAHTGLDAPFFVWLSYITGARLKTVVSCKIEISGMKERFSPLGCFRTAVLGLSMSTLAGTPPKNSRAF